MLTDAIQEIPVDYRSKILAEFGQEALDACLHQHQVVVNHHDTGTNDLAPPRNGFPYQDFYEKTLGKMTALEKVMSQFIALQPAIRDILGEERLAEQQPGIDMMLWTQGLPDSWRGLVMANLAEPTHWWLSDSKNRYKRFEEAQAGLRKMARIMPPKVLRLAARNNAAELVKMGLSAYNDNTFKDIMVAELGRWEYDPVDGVKFPFKDNALVPSATAIECLLTQAPAKIDKDPEGLIFHTIEQFRLRYLAKAEISESEATRIIKALLATPTRQTGTRLNDLKYYKRHPGEPKFVYLENGPHEWYIPNTLQEDPLPQEGEYIVDPPAADGISITDVYRKRNHPRRRVHNQYTILMIASIYHMQGITQQLLRDPRVQLLKTTKLLTRKDVPHLSIREKYTEWVHECGNHITYDLFDTPVDVLRILKSMFQHSPVAHWTEKHNNIIELVRSAYIDTFCKELNEAAPSMLSEIRAKYEHAKITVTDVTKHLFQAAKLAADQEITNEKKIEVLGDAINHAPSRCALAAFLGDKERSRLFTQLFTELQRYTTVTEGSHTSSLSIVKAESKNDSAQNDDKKKEKAENNKL